MKLIQPSRKSKEGPQNCLSYMVPLFGISFQIQLKKQKKIYFFKNKVKEQLLREKKKNYILLVLKHFRDVRARKYLKIIVLLRTWMYFTAHLLPS